jgi:hypothetical protein
MPGSVAQGIHSGLARTCAAIAVAIAWAVVPIVISPTVASAATCGSAGSYQVGTTAVPQTNYYAQATISLKPATLCGASDSFSTVWVMIASNNSLGWAQTGYIYRAGYSGAYLYAQAVRQYPSTPQTVYMAGAPSSALYYDSYYFNQGDMGMVANGNNLVTSNFDPVVSWTAPWIPEWEGETHYSGDDVPGTSASPTYFSNMGIITGRSGPPVNPSGLSLHNNDSNFGAAWDISQSKFHIWSKS